MPDPAPPTAPAPTLEAPGAGLPWYELAVAKRVLFPLHCARLGWAGASRLFQAEGERVLALLALIPPERQAERILVARLPGMEDSSRYWSAAMTVEHLNIVGFQIRRLIGALRAGQVPAQKADVAAVKPTGLIPPGEARAEFVRLLAEAESDTSPAVPRGQGPTAEHPWFGPLTAYQWHCLLGIHQGIHRKQLEAIRAKL